MKANRVSVILLVILALILGLSLRGLPGNPTPADLQSPAWKEGGPFELSPERGRFALTYSLVEDHSFTFSPDLARFAIPDLGFVDGRFVSLFAPGVSFLLILGYLIGKILAGAQVGTYATIAVAGLINAYLIRTIALRLGSQPFAAWLAALTFLFATPAYAYAVSLYQHQLSVLILLLSLLAYVAWRAFWSPLLIWFLWAAAISVDYPNFFLLLPLGLATLARLVRIGRSDSQLSLHIDLPGWLAMLVVVLPLSFFAWTNLRSYGHPLRLSGTVENVRSLDDQGRPEPQAWQEGEDRDPTQEGLTARPVLGFFQTRNLVRGLLVHTVGVERGVVVYTPVVLMGFLGAAVLYRRRPRLTAVIIAISVTNLILYSLWGDPWGGWAFGSRYLIPSYALLAILLASFLSEERKSRFVMLVFLITLTYSIAVNTLGAITTNRVPPKGEAEMLAQVYAQDVPYTYRRNWIYLQGEGTKSFAYQTLLRGRMTPQTFYYLLTGSIVGVAIALFWGLIRAKDDRGGGVDA